MGELPATSENPTHPDQPRGVIDDNLGFSHLICEWYDALLVQKLNIIVWGRLSSLWYKDSKNTSKRFYFEIDKKNL